MDNMHKIESNKILTILFKKSFKEDCARKKSGSDSHVRVRNI